MQDIEIPETLSILPTNNDKVLLPGIVARYSIQRQDSQRLIESLYSKQSRKQSDMVIGVVPLLPSKMDKTPKVKLKQANRLIRAFEGDDKDVHEPISRSRLSNWGVAARIIDIQKYNRSEFQRTGISHTITIEGIARIQPNILTLEPFITAKCTVHPEQEIDVKDAELQALIISLRTTGNELIQSLSKLSLPPQVLSQMRDMLKNTPAGQLTDLLASMIDSSLEEKLLILSTSDLKPRIQKVLELMKRQIQVLGISQQLQTTVENKLGKKQREFLLREQLEAIKKELGETDDDQNDESSDIFKLVNDAKLSPEAKKVAQKELRRLKRMNPNMAEYQVIRNYLEWIIELPWSTTSQEFNDISKARQILDQDHQGLNKVKTRIIEYLAIRKLKKDIKGPILCFVGPPGVGKTSLGKSIATALGRKFYRIALGGVRDEAEIRGHRRTYVSALPGLIIQGIHKCGVGNPVILLDEIDKISRDSRGDPSSAMLEVLDPEQNNTFTDHYLNIPFDLSKVLFIATANDISSIPPPLLDRMELIELPGYTLDEKMDIARRHLLPKQIIRHGLTEDLVAIDDKVLRKIVTGYTREAGVRNLEREVATVLRHQSLAYADAIENDRMNFYQTKITAELLEKILGQEKYLDEVSERHSIPGVVTGLAYTGLGSGGILFIEGSYFPGNGKLKLTGKLGEVIQESCEIALTFVKVHAKKLGITFDFNAHDIHIHFPAGATPKDGPSAGVTIVTAIVSLLTRIPVRDYTAMTGEISLRGLVLPVGGIKEKLLAAHRANITRVILPIKNKKDADELPLDVRNEIDLIYCKTIDQVLAAAFNANLNVLDSKL